MIESDRHSIGLRLAYPFLKVACFLLFLRYGAVIVPHRRRRVPRQGGMIILSNHQSNTDPIVVQYACPRLINYMTRREIFEMGRIGKFITWWKAFPITQRKPEKESLKKAIDLARAGHAVGIFPEGMLSPDGKLVEVLPGAALVVKRAKVPVICVGLVGTRRLMPDPDTKPRWAGCLIHAYWGEPRLFGDEAEIEEIVAWAEAELKGLIGEAGE